MVVDGSWVVIVRYSRSTLVGRGTYEGSRGVSNYDWWGVVGDGFLGMEGWDILVCGKGEGEGGGFWLDINIFRLVVEPRCRWWRGW